MRRLDLEELDSIWDEVKKEQGQPGGTGTK
jgi:hypothetical protein